MLVNVLYISIYLCFDDVNNSFLLSYIEKSAFNVGVILYNQSLFSKAAGFLKKCILYTLANPLFQISDAEVSILLCHLSAQILQERKQIKHSLLFLSAR